MELFDALITEVSRPVYEVTMFGVRFSWLFLLSAAIIAMLVYRSNAAAEIAQKPWSLKEALKATFPRKVFLHPSALLDYRYAIVNYVLQVAAFGALMLGVTQVAQGVIGLLTLLLGPMPAEAAAPGLAMSALFGLLILLALDGGLFFAHWLMHMVPVLWEFHKVHHSAEVLTPVTVLRMHPIDMIINSIVTSVLIGTVNGVFFYAYSGPVAELWLFGSNAAVFVFFFFGYHLRHSHVWVMFPKGIREFISSPALHLIHHSSDPKHFDRNFGRIFVFWDRLAKSLYMPREREELVFGIGGDEDGRFDSVYNLYVLPFLHAARHFRRASTDADAVVAPAGQVPEPAAQPADMPADLADAEAKSA